MDRPCMLLAVCLFVIVSLPHSFAVAAESAAPARPAATKVNTLIDLLDLETSTTTLVASMLHDTIAATPAWRRHEDILVDYAEERIGWEVLHPLIASLYEDYFDAREITALIEFYTSPAGRKLIKVAPVMGDRMRSLVTERFDADLDLLELRMKSREMELLEQDITFYPELVD